MVPENEYKQHILEKIEEVANTSRQNTQAQLEFMASSLKQSSEASFEIIDQKIKLTKEELCEHINDKIEKNQHEIIDYVDASMRQVRDEIMTTINSRFNEMVEVLRERHVEPAPHAFTPTSNRETTVIDDMHLESTRQSIVQSPIEPMNQDNEHSTTSTGDIPTESQVPQRVQTARQSIVQSPIELFNKLPETQKNYFKNSIAPLLQRGLTKQDTMCRLCKETVSACYKMKHLLYCKEEANSLFLFDDNFKKIKDSFIFSKTKCDFCEKEFTGANSEKQWTEHNIIEHYSKHFAIIHKSLC
jgi:hypothetical protein